MAAHTYGISEIVGTSETSIDDAIKGAIAPSSPSIPAAIRGPRAGPKTPSPTRLCWLGPHVRGHLQDGAVGHYQVTIKVGFRIED